MKTILSLLLLLFAVSCTRNAKENGFEPNGKKKPPQASQVLANCPTDFTIVFDGQPTTYSLNGGVGLFAFNVPTTGSLPEISYSGSGYVTVEFAEDCADFTQVPMPVYVTFNTTKSDDGVGIWAIGQREFNVPIVLQSETTYYLRIKATGTVTLISKLVNPPANRDCESATEIPVFNVNNANHMPSPHVSGDPNLYRHNPAWHKLTVSTTDTIGLKITNDPDGFFDYHEARVFVLTACGHPSDAPALYRRFQVGRGEVVLRLGSYPVGTVFYVVVDGESGANCKYSLETVTL